MVVDLIAHSFRPPSKFSPPRPRHEGIAMSQDRPLGQGVLELNPKGFGFLRKPAKNYVPQPTDAYVPGPLIQKWKLREGLSLSGPLEAARPGTQARLHKIDQIEDAPAESYRLRSFDELTPIDPNEQIFLET